MEVATPIAFEVVAEGREHPIRAVRHELRDRFRREGFLERIIPDMERALNAGEPGEQMPEELAGVRLEVAAPEDAPWYQAGGAEAPPPRWRVPEKPHPGSRPSGDDPSDKGDGLPF